MKSRTVRGLRAALLSGVALWAASVGSLTQADTPKPVLERGKGEACVLPTEEMRRNHMHLLKHDRDKTMRLGIRDQADGKPIHGSLNQCIECHATKDEQGNFHPITSEKHFCTACHVYASVKLDCFECHATRPESARIAEKAALKAIGGK
jgi:hypothetical protein